VTTALFGPTSFGGAIWERMVSILRARFSTIMRRLAGLVNSSLMSVPSSSCSSVAAIWMCPGTPGTARGEIPLEVFL
jgi:hypothetical protein